MTEPLRPSVLFARQVRAILAEKDWSQRQLLERLAAVGVDMSRATLSKLLSWDGRYGPLVREPTLDDLFAVAAAFPTSPVDLLVNPEAKVQPTPQGKPLSYHAWLSWIQGRQDVPAEQRTTRTVGFYDIDKKLKEIKEQGDILARAGEVTELRRIILALQDALYFLEERQDEQLEKLAEESRRRRAARDEGAS